MEMPGEISAGAPAADSCFLRLVEIKHQGAGLDHKRLRPSSASDRLRLSVNRQCWASHTPLADLPTSADGLGCIASPPPNTGSAITLH